MFGGYIADAIIPAVAISTGTTQVTTIVSQLSNLISWISIFTFIAGLVTIGILFGKFFVAFTLWVVNVVIWFFVGHTSGNNKKAWPNLFNPKRNDYRIKACLIAFLVRYIIVIAYKIMALPKCFLWYFLDTAGWALYLPFKFTFWFIDYMLNVGLVEMEYKGWDLLGELDYFIHGRPKDNYFMYQYEPDNPNVDGNGEPLIDGADKNTMNTGGHIIHFPDSVMYQCYAVSPYSLMKFPPFPTKEWNNMLNFSGMSF
jgi:hypothetical protein